MAQPLPPLRGKLSELLGNLLRKDWQTAVVDSHCLSCCGGQLEMVRPKYYFGKATAADSCTRFLPTINNSCLSAAKKGLHREVSSLDTDLALP